MIFFEEVLLIKKIAGREGIEPSSKVLETLILPLNYRPLLTRAIITVN